MKNTRRMSCGNCGGKLFNIEADDSDSPTVLVFECIHCHSTTIYRNEIPRMQQLWGDASEGVTCFLRE